MNDDRKHTLFEKPDRVAEPLYVVTPVYNPIRFRSRWKLYERFQQQVVDAGAVLYTVEAAFGDREHSLADIAPHGTPARAPVIADELEANCAHDAAHRGLHRYVPLRTREELWLKENLINVGVAHLPHDWKYVAWVDADVAFLRPNWVGEAIQQLQHYDFIQMFSHVQDVGPDYSVHTSSDSFVLNWSRGTRLPEGYYSAMPAISAKGAWSGLAWACTRRAWDAVGGLMDFSIHGGGDWHTAFALVGAARHSMRSDLSPGYVGDVLAWEALAERHVRRNVGVMTGTVVHYWHGRKVHRRYVDRHELLAVTQFDPRRDLKRDAQGLWQLVDDGSERFLMLRDGLRYYARERREDGNEL